MIFLDNGIIKLGVVPEWKGVIGYLSQSGSSRNIFTANRFDDGVLGQSYWGDPGGPGMAWPWDPIQGGTFNGDYGDSVLLPPGIAVDGNTIYCKVRPVQFDYTEGNTDPNMEMDQWITLMDNVVKVRCRATYIGPDLSGNYLAYPEENAAWYGKTGWNQETPAISFSPEFNRRKSYVGNAPWTGAPITDLGITPPNEYGVPDVSTGSGNADFIVSSEKWAAALDENGWGVGVFAPSSDAIRLVNIGDATYMTPSTMFNFTNGAVTPVVFDYTIFLALGTVAEIRQNFAAVREMLLQPPPNRLHGKSGGKIHGKGGGRVSGKPA